LVILIVLVLIDLLWWLGLMITAVLSTEVIALGKQVTIVEGDAMEE
jgi:hypothetical protein